MCSGLPSWYYNNLLLQLPCTPHIIVGTRLRVGCMAVDVRQSGCWAIGRRQWQRWQRCGVWECSGVGGGATPPSGGAYLGAHWVPAGGPLRTQPIISPEGSGAPPLYHPACHTLCYPHPTYPPCHPGTHQQCQRRANAPPTLPVGHPGPGVG